MAKFREKGMVSKEEVGAVCRNYIHKSEEEERNELVVWTRKQLAVLWTKIVLACYSGMKKIKQTGYYDTILEDKEVLKRVIEYLLSSISSEKRDLLMHLLHLNTSVLSY
eukprot:TRINITY_DN3793_c0_g1_i1.p2 TRINITY_DN3793_c0_g1~~TRINITY_DN3793_c0_g1_i1.p2  ORF type:complete len:109 (-),score=34.22 TRINITY_DN3793_c0_g1_i1:782-1108(-)